MVSEHPGLAQRSGPRIAPDPSRVIARLFIAGHEGFDREDSRANAVLARVMALPEEEIEELLVDLGARFDGRHRNLLDVFDRHAGELADHFDGEDVSDARRLVIGATFTSEYSIEGAAVCNPRIVAHPDQSDVGAGALRFVMSVRGIGEGHTSSVGFHTGTVDAAGKFRLDHRSPYATRPRREPSRIDAAPLRVELGRAGEMNDNAAYVLDALPSRFDRAELNARLVELHEHRRTRTRTARTIAVMEAVADRWYGASFAAETELSERVLWPSTRAEVRGMEDARFVRFTDDDGTRFYHATYTAYDGDRIVQQLLSTADFVDFTSAPLVGDAAANKGLALFPRRIAGRYAALSRCDRETNSIAFSDDLHHWALSTPLHAPERSWELLQVGNCGSPLETDLGWLVLTHGVGPMRTYSIGAMLLDLDDPTTVIGALAAPLLKPAAAERDGYVPNVVYSCGALLHAGTLVLPYGMSDGAIAVATVSADELLGTLTGSRRE